MSRRAPIDAILDTRKPFLDHIENQPVPHFRIGALNRRGKSIHTPFTLLEKQSLS